MKSLIVHGGAKEIPAEQEAEHREGCRAALEAGWNVLSVGGSSLDAVEAAIRKLEELPVFNAGYGSELNADGEVQMDAGLMEGTDLKAGAVAFIQGVRHPISVARKVLEGEEVLIAGDGAIRFAKLHSLELCDNHELETLEKRQKWEAKVKSNNTVGAVALDDSGNIAAGASTGGTGANRRGRVGDTPLVGCGFYADSARGGCAMTGDGEEITRLVLAKFAVDVLCTPDIASNRAITHLADRLGGEGGCIMLDAKGQTGWAHSSRDMAVAYQTDESDGARVFLQKRQER